jgi:hypothetical protein
MRQQMRRPTMNSVLKIETGDDRQRAKLIARSTMQAVEYLIQKNDPERLRAWLAKRSRAERLEIKRNFQRQKCPCRAR